MDKMILTEEQAARFGESYNRLFKEALAQLAEHKMHLSRYVETDTTLSAQQRQQLMLDVEELKLVSVMVEPKVKDQHDRATVSVVYEYTDELHNYVSSTVGAINPAAQHGITLDDKPAVSPFKPAGR